MSIFADMIEISENNRLEKIANTGKCDFECTDCPLRSSCYHNMLLSKRKSTRFRKEKRKKTAEDFILNRAMDELIND